ncbi:MAG TPA: hypothetical protein VMJ10_06485 [Kofleriaceae bacterium]|nr:hypothetical protein [Kofleriaceae bacterium]
MDSHKLIGMLAIEGDRACVQGDLGELVRAISELVAEPLHCELVAFADLYRIDPVRASEQWPLLRERLFQVER